MKHLAAYALLVLGGKAEPTEADVENVLKEAGVKADPEQLKALMGAVKGKKLHELIAAGMGKIQSAGAAPAPAKADKKEAKPEPKKEAKKEVKKEEKHEEPADVGLAGGLNIFGDDM